MTPLQIRQARWLLGLSRQQLGELLGYEPGSARQMLCHLEADQEPRKQKRGIGKCQARLLQAYLDGYRPADWPESE